MNFVQPIRDLDKIEAMKRELLKSGSRNYILFVMGINTGLRISDLLPLKVNDVRNRSHITIIENKTGKQKRHLLSNIKSELDQYILDMNDDDYLFQSRNGENKPIQRYQAYNILNNAARKVGINEEIGTHTMRKTFGYHFYQKTKDVALLQNLFNHSSPSVTLRYIGINQDILDEAVRDFKL
jgi:Site-specific recombinase XerD